MEWHHFLNLFMERPSYFGLFVQTQDADEIGIQVQFAPHLLMSMHYCCMGRLSSQSVDAVPLLTSFHLKYF